jgi:hypothetical protein
MPLRYTREEILGYGKGTTTVKIQQEIRAELDACQREHLEP